MSFDPSSYGPAFAELLSTDRSRALDGGSPNPEARAALRRLTVEAAFAGQRLVDPRLAECCLSAAWLLHDFLDESHSLSQSIETPEGSFWHGVMHRREGDYSNAKYWFRRVGEHPVYELLVERFGGWDPYDFVDQCAAAVRTGENLWDCRQCQQAEWELMFDYCHRGAVA